jgi:hypothetical protein
MASYSSINDRALTRARKLIEARLLLQLLDRTSRD